MTEESILEARELARVRLAILQRADAYSQLIQSAGWKYFSQVQEAWLAQVREEARKVDTGKLDVAIAALQRWQLAEDLILKQVNHVNQVLDEATEIRGSRTLEDAVMMAEVQNEHREPGNSADPTGY